jgi:hypothetical protein
VIPAAIYPSQIPPYTVNKAATGLVPISYRGALLSSHPQANVYVTQNLLNVLVQIANNFF